jgi:hypothetical protein
VKNNRPDRRTYELGRIWQLLTIYERNSWLRLARAMGGKRAKDSAARLLHTTLILALALMWTLPFSLRSTMLAIGAGYVLAVNLAIVRVCFEGMRGRLR